MEGRAPHKSRFGIDRSCSANSAPRIAGMRSRSPNGLSARIRALAPVTRHRRSTSECLTGKKRAAIAAVPFESPKLSVVATLDSFATRLEEWKLAACALIDADAKALGSE
jgi:hypothetical protein